MKTFILCAVLVLAGCDITGAERALELRRAELVEPVSSTEPDKYGVVCYSRLNRVGLSCVQVFFPED
jgi:hypothetical protein